MSNIDENYIDILNSDEPHPAYITALNFLNSIPIGEFPKIKEFMEKNSKDGVKIGEVCVWAIDRFMTGKPLTDRHILGLAWTIIAMIHEELRRIKGTNKNESNKKH